MIDKTASIVLKTDKDRLWKNELQKKMPKLDIQIWPDIKNPNLIKYALLWDPQEALFQQLTNLEVIFSIGAGIDGIVKNRSFPEHIPLIRLCDNMLSDAMVEYVVYSVLRIHRKMVEYEKNQHNKKWQVLEQIPAADQVVGMMGLGQLGKRCACSLASFGFKVIGYSRGKKSINGIDCYKQDQFDDFIKQANILVCLLPLTNETYHILNKETFNKMPLQSSIINVGRGGHVNEQDLLEALDKRIINHAILDVFESEPITEDHPFWSHPNITLTPHIASQTIPNSAVNHIIDGINRHRTNKPLHFVYDPAKGY